ncbi:MAG TPA: hypothetical protein VEL76_33910 [Gemmataceae bacterium]|nr:hypothetical protein [Gemmataceae bacterium]
MTEAEWLSTDDPVLMLHFLEGEGRASARKLRLTACACCRRLWHLLPEKRRAAIEAMEGFADRLVSEAARATYEDADVIGHPSGEYAVYYTSLPTRSFRTAVYNVAHCAALTVSDAAPSASRTRAREAERAAQLELIRCVFGNPFRPVSVVRSWKTRDKVTLARAAYEERTLPARTLDPARLAALADALEQARCTDADLLGHLRGPGPHIRGCWVVDLVLGKS